MQSKCHEKPILKTSEKSIVKNTNVGNKYK